ncbi:hypothetical protein ABG768_010681 [Culter alburnus]|uniref:Myb/SANT-like DNA-binding domain-containing protein n=1 Tax=Culter alburnus TaxID=194366 RepID=A0AAW1ZCP5_CULAL
MADVSGNFCYKLTDEEIRTFIHLRGIHDRLFTGSRNSARDSWKFIIEEMGLQGRLSPQQAGRKWENLKKTYKELKAPQSGVSTEGCEETAATWKWFSAMHEANGSKPSIQPSVLIASCSTENPSAAEREHPGSSPEQSGSSAEQSGSSAEQPGPSSEQQGPLSEDRGTLRLTSTQTQTPGSQVSILGQKDGGEFE